MKKCIANIGLSKILVASDCKGENKAHHGRLNNQTESVSVINAVELSETFGNQVSLVFIDRYTRVFLDLENPLAADDILTRRPRDERPLPIRLKGPELVEHGRTPPIIRECQAMRGWDGEKCKAARVVPNSAIGRLEHLDNIIFEAGDHSMGGWSWRRRAW